MHEMCSYIGLTERDVELLREMAPVLEPQLPAMAERFYSFILRNEAVGRIIESGGYDVQKLTGSLVEWARGLTSGTYDEAYAQARLLVGTRHVHIGVEPRYTLAAFSLVRSFFQEVIQKKYVDQPQLCAESLGAMNRILDLDQCLINQAYDIEHQAVIVKEKDVEIRKERDFIAAVLETAGSLVVVLDTEGRIVRFNRACEKVSGYTAEEMMGRHVWDMLLIPEEIEPVKAVFENITTVQFPNQYENFWLTKDGARRLIAWSHSVLLDGEGAVEYVIGTGVDITEQREMQSQIQHQEKMSAVGQLAAGVAHEIGNPLASISAVAQTLRRKSNDKFVQEKLELVGKHIDRISNTVRQMVDFARPPRFEWKTCRMNAVIENALGIVRFDKRAKNISIDLNLAEGIPQTCALEDQLTQVFINIALNALDALESTPDERAPSLTIASRSSPSARGRSIQVVFEDNGPGIEPSAVQRIFEPFFTTKDVGRGTGLGLAVCYRIIQVHGGIIHVDGRPGEGARFTIEIPIREEEPEKS